MLPGLRPSPAVKGNEKSAVAWLLCIQDAIEVPCLMHVIHVVIAAPNVVKHKARIYTRKDDYLCFCMRALARTQVRLVRIQPLLVFLLALKLLPQRLAQPKKPHQMPWLAAPWSTS